METLVHRSEIFRNLALTAAAAVGASPAWKNVGPGTTQAGTAVVQAELARRAHVMELFNRAAGQLGDDKMEVRLAAIYILGEITVDFPDLSGSVFKLLENQLDRKMADFDGGRAPFDARAIAEVVAKEGER
ncbi:hypothetical protein LQ948_12705 [Jiella sp. MQZ9-1]|uniref:Uncharacterized protein n=1 Tax=Jiella flava TaxID=2816857 RepID=A0A939FZC2_9HYPH|nr:hypothetical protein [Jiella flava]MBO0663496.1 hypothetical protein [Jiella flava]MCD2472071.1 hypothetical protein [Jiella flava]